MDRLLWAAAAILLTVYVVYGTASAGEQGKTERRLLRAAEGVQLPGSESDTFIELVSFSREQDLPTVEGFEKRTSCRYPEGGTSRSDFDAAFDRWTRLARLGGYDPKDYRRLRRTFEKRYEELTVYSCETEGPRTSSTSSASTIRASPGSPRPASKRSGGEEAHPVTGAR